MEPLLEHGVTLAGSDTRALELEGDGPPLIFFHGFADSADTWRGVLDLLARAGRRAVALDLPGFGEADDLVRGAILPQLDRFAKAALVEFGSDDAIVVGNSLGGAVTLRLAQDPEVDLGGIVPIAPAGLDHARWLRVIQTAPLLQALLASPVPLPAAVVRPVVGTVYRRLAFATPAAADPRVVRSFTSHLNSLPVVSRRLAIGNRLLPEITADPFQLDEIDCRVLVIWGKRDVMVYPSGAERILKEVPRSELRLLPHVGHCPQVEVPATVFELLEEFAAPLARAA